MLSKKPYLLRAMYDWIADNGWTPHIVVDADTNEAALPRQYVQDGHIVLNIATSAVQGLDIGNDEVSFSARFSGTPFNIVFPVESVAGIYARENNEGLQFVVTKVEASDESPLSVADTADEENAPEDMDIPEPVSDAPKPKTRPKLTVVKPTADKD